MAANYLELIFIQKGEYLFHEGDESNLFYGVIKGKISLRKEKKINKNIKFFKNLKINKLLKGNDNEKTEFVNNLFINIREIIKRKRISQKELLTNNNKNFDNDLKKKKEELSNIYIEELFQRSEGYCFGDWGLIYHQNRSCSVYALEDTYFFSLNFEQFEKTFFQCLQKSDQIKRKFIQDNLFPFPISSHDYSKILYNNLIPIECNHNFTIFTEEEKAKCVFIIYKGEFVLRKKIFNDVYKEKKNYKIFNIQKGGIIGLESLFEENSNYLFSLYSSNNYDNYYLFSLAVDKVPLNILLKMKIHLKESYINFINITNHILEKQVYVRKKLFKNRSLPSLITDYEKCQNAIKFYLKSRKKNKNHDNQNNIKNSNHNMKLENTKIIQPFQMYNKIKNINLKKIKFTHSDLLSYPKKNYISRNTSSFRIYNGNLNKKYKNISLNSSFLVNYNFEKKFQLKKSLSQKVMTKETKFSSKEHSFLNKEQIFKLSKNTNRNHSDTIYELQKTIGKPILRNNYNIQINLFENKRFLNSYFTGSYNIPLVSNLV